MGTFYRYSNLTTKGNHRLVEAGLDVISNEDNQKYNFFVGQPIAYNPFDGKTLSIADIATAKAVRFGVGHNPNKKALMATEIRHLGGGNYIDLCKTMLDIKVSQPGCPTPFVIDFDFGCTWTGRDYMFQLDIDDWLTRSYFKEGAVGSMLYNLRTDLSGCQSCSEEENCDALADQLADKINGDYIKDFPGTSKLGLNTGMPGQGVWAVQKFESTRTFTIAASAVEDSCGEGCAVKGLKSISATGITTKTFVNAVDPAAPTQTLVEQLASVISQMNTAISGHGSVYLKKVDCCTYEIEANTDLENLVITYHDDSTADFEDTATVFAAGTTCGVRVYLDPLELPCHCQYPDSNPPSYFHRTAKITAWGDGWNDTSYEATIVSKGSIAVGTGYEVQQNELKQSNGGEGWDYAYGKSYSDGRYPLPLDSSAYNQASVADCDGLYCIWSVVVQDHFAPSQHARNVQNSQSVNWVNVPRGDSDTIEDIEALFTALADRGFCSSAVIECVPASS